jgi:hypothetical protein
VWQYELLLKIQCQACFRPKEFDAMKKLLNIRNRQHVIAMAISNSISGSNLKHGEFNFSA